jgi:hypothetical protein
MRGFRTFYNLLAMTIKNRERNTESHVSIEQSQHIHELEGAKGVLLAVAVAVFDQLPL